MIESDLKDAEKDIGNKNWKGAFYYAGRALLIVRGIEVRSAEDAIAGFKKEFVEKGIASARFRNVEEVLENIEEGDFSSYIEDFCQEVKRLYWSMDNNFQFPKKHMEKEKQVFKERVLDLSGVACPLNYVKTKLYLENIPRGERVKIILDEGEPMKNVPESLKNDGHKIIKVEKKENKYELEVEK